LIHPNPSSYGSTYKLVDIVRIGHRERQRSNLLFWTIEYIFHHQYLGGSMVSLSRFSLEGKIALVTGASRGIGRATALGLAEAGADVVVCSRKLPALEKVADEIRRMGRKSLPVPAHIAKLEDIRRLIETVTAEFGKIDILVNNAGTAPGAASALDADERLWDAIINLNLKGLYFLSQAVARVMKESGGGRIINVASIFGYRPPETIGIYSISKAAVLMVTKSMALELAPYNIRVNAVVSGPVNTRILDALWSHLPEDEAKNQKAEMAKKVPLRHIAEPEEIVGSMIYLASDASSYTTGAALVVDGGVLLTSVPI
jgi:NAD(P)-dependent dehydrogenase (short-subunit alcohol dehydrogenase family)